MGGGGPDNGDTYSPAVAGIYIFNLIVGAGALAMPSAFGESGFVAGSILIGVLAFTSYLTVTYMNEAMSIANAFFRKEEEKKTQSIGIADDVPINSLPSDDMPLLGVRKYAGQYEIKTRAEMGHMAEMFYGPWGVKLFYFTTVVYLYGDLCIYAVAVPKSLQSVACGTLNKTEQHHFNGTHECMGSLDSKESYYVFLALFAAVLGPFCFFNAQKTKWLQLFTTVMRWSTFLLMIGIALAGIAKKKGFDKSDHVPKPSDVKVADIAGLPTLFGVAIYSFMCHHSLPSLITPMTSKRRLNSVLIFDFALVLGFYCLLCMTAVFRFDSDKLEDLYTLNFQDYSVAFISYFLALFPVFTLSANFPIIAITLRNNLKQLLTRKDKPFHPTFDRFFFPLIAIGPPILVAFFTENVKFLVSFTGSYAGVGIQYVIPTTLLLAARTKQRAELGSRDVNVHKTFFSAKIWQYIVLGWSFVCIALVTFNHAYYRE